MKAFSILLVAIAVSANALAAEATMSRAEVRAYYKMVQRLDPKFRAAEKLWELEDALGANTDQFPTERVVALVRPSEFETKKAGEAPEKPERRSAEVPPGGFSRQQVQDYFSILEKQDAQLGKQPGQVQRLTALEQKYGVWEWYAAAEVRDAEKNREKFPETAAPKLAKLRPPEGWRVFHRGLRSLKIRSDWTDLLAAEDITQIGTKNPNDNGDLVGAKLSYAHAGKKNSDTVSVVGSLIIPFTWYRHLNYVDSGPAVVSVAPSISINKVDTNGDPKGEVDYVYYRLGLFAKWINKNETSNRRSSLQARAAIVWATDTNFDGDIYGAELDLEPQLLFPGGESWSLGYKNVLISKQPVLENGSDSSLVDLQFRAWLHGEAGEVQRNSAKWETVEGSFFRAGPTIQAQLNFPEWWRGVSFTARYSYFEPFSGSDDHNNLVKISAAITLFELKERGQKISLAADYEKGGLILSKEYVETTTIGLSIVY